MVKREFVSRCDGQLDVFEVIADVEENGLVPGKGIDPVVVKVGMEFIVMVNGERANDKKYWSQSEAWSFIDGLLAHARKEVLKSEG